MSGLRIPLAVVVTFMAGCGDSQPTAPKASPFIESLYAKAQIQTTEEQAVAELRRRGYQLSSLGTFAGQWRETVLGYHLSFSVVNDYEHTIGQFGPHERSQQWILDVMSVAARMPQEQVNEVFRRLLDGEHPVEESKCIFSHIPQIIPKLPATVQIRRPVN